MSQYTTELRFLIQQNYDLGLKDYPLFDESYRQVLNKKIMDEYFFREIGQETPDRFKHYLNHTMNMIMPYYNQMYQSQLLEIDPLMTYRDTETMKRNIDTENNDASTEMIRQDKDVNLQSTESQVANSAMTGTSSVDGTATASTLGTETTNEDTINDKTENKFNVDSTTPGGMIAIADIKTHTWASSATMGEGTTGDIGSSDRTVAKDEDVTSVTNQVAVNTAGSDTTADINANKTENEVLQGTNSANRTGTIETVDEYLKTKFGFAGNQSKLLEAYRKTFLNIDVQIVKELNCLFMGLY